MRIKPLYAVLAVIASLACCAMPAHAQFDVGMGFYRDFMTSSSGNGTVQTPSDSYGFMYEMRYVKDAYRGGEISFTFNPDDETYSPTATNCGYICAYKPETVKAYAINLAFLYVVTKQMGKWRPFGDAGLGFVMTDPPGNEYAVNTSVKPSFEYGVGTDYALSPHFGIRAQYRGNLYSAPQTTFAFPATKQPIHVAQPTIGVYFRP